MSVVLSEHLLLLASAPEGIKKLRGLILELAVRGKLVPQDPDDEPASELLKRIANKRPLLNGASTRKKSEKSPLLRMVKQPFSTPSSWAWACLGDTVEVLDSLRKPVTKSDRKPGPYPYYGASGVVDYVSDYLFDEDLVLVGEDGAKWGVGDRTAFPISGKTWVNNHAHVLRPHRDVLTDSFLIQTLVARDLQPFITGMTVPKLNQVKLISIEIPIPPLAEQHRIVAKVDELMVLCDRLEAEQSDSDTAHVRLVETLLGTLTHSADADELGANWQLLAAHFDTLFATEAGLDALKRAVILLAVDGVLTNEKGFEKRRLQDLIDDAGYGTSQKSDSARQIGGCPVLRIPNVVREKLNLSELKFSVIADKELQKLRLADGDILIVRTNGSADLVGRCAVVSGLIEDTVFASYLIKLRFSPELIAPAFAQLVLRNHRQQSNMIDFARTTAGQYNVSIGRLNGLEMPVPSLDQQHRIVAKVDELMALCDRLKADLVDSRSHQARLAGTLIAAALEAA